MKNLFVFLFLCNFLLLCHAHGGGNYEHSDSIALTKSLPIAVCRLCRAGLALSGASRQLSQRESLEAAPKHKISNSCIKMLDSLPGVW